jgi:hypothetical protein
MGGLGDCLLLPQRSTNKNRPIELIGKISPQWKENAFHPIEKRIAVKLLASDGLSAKITVNGVPDRVCCLPIRKIKICQQIDRLSLVEVYVRANELYQCLCPVNFQVVDREKPRIFLE